MPLVLASVLLAQLAAPTQPQTPRFERAECRFEPPVANRPECGWLIVPEVRGGAPGRMLRLAVAIYRARERAQAPPVLLLHGGPGGYGGVRAPLATFEGILRSPIAQSRDIVVFDMRAAGLSEPSLCPDFYEDATLVFNRRQPEERVRGYTEAVRECSAWLKAHGIEATAYSTSNTAADVIDLRKLLGYSTWDLFGVSYGAQVAQELMAGDAAAIRAVVLVSLATTSGTEAGEMSFTHQRAIERVFASCAQQPECQAAFPTLQNDFYELYEEFDRQPFEVRTARGSVWLDGGRFVFESRNHLRFTAATRLPLLIDEMRRGERARAAAQFVGDGLMRPFQPIAHLVGCNDYGAGYGDAVAGIRSQLRPAFQAIADDIREHCDGWGASPVRGSPPKVARDIPTLMVNGAIDPHGTDLHSRRLAAILSRAYVYDVPGRGHEPLGRCVQTIIDGFLLNPAREPDAACLANEPAISFTTREQTAPLTMAIAAEAGVRSGFAGTWQGSYPLPAGRSLGFELTTDGHVVKGVLRRVPAPPEPLAVSGTIRDDTIALTVAAPNGQGTLTLTGTLMDGGIVFEREASLSGPGQGFFSATGQSSFTMIRSR